MTITQKIHYNSDNTYLAGFLQHLIDECAVRGSVWQEKGVITLHLDPNDTKGIECFSMLAPQRVPHSLFIGEITTAQAEGEVHIHPFVSEDYPIAPCPRCLEMLIDPASDHYLDDTLRCRHYANRGEWIEEDLHTYTAHYADGHTLLVVDPQSVHQLFYITDEEQKALFSIEKPTLKVTIKDATLKDLTGKHFISIKSPFNVKSTLVALNAKEAEIPYLFFQDRSGLSAAVLQKEVFIIHDERGVSKRLQALNGSLVENRFLNICNEAGYMDALCASISTQNGISFLMQRDGMAKKLLEFGRFDLQNILEGMSKHSTYSRLLENFWNKFPALKEDLLEKDLDLFETICTILELDQKSFESFSDKSMEFHGNGGLKIDMNFDENGFDYTPFLTSMMSFRLAGVEVHFLAYSIMEALGDMVISTLSQLKSRYKISNIVMMGNIFANSVLHSRIKSKFSLSNPYFSRGFALDD